MKSVLYVVPALALSLVGCSSSTGSTASPPTTSAPLTSTTAPTSAAVTSTSVAPPTSAAASATSSSAAPSSASPAPVKTEPVVPDVKAQVLALSDLPAGWSRHKLVKDNSRTPRCLKALDAPTPQSAVHAEVAYQGTPRGLPALNESLSYAPKVASKEFVSAVKALNRCQKISFRSGTTTFSGVLGPISFPAMGDQSEAYEVAFSGVVKDLKVTAGFDLLLVRVGDEELTLLYSVIGVPDIRDFQAGVKLAMDKVKAAGTTA